MAEINRINHGDSEDKGKMKDRKILRSGVTSSEKYHRGVNKLLPLNGIY